MTACFVAIAVGIGFFVWMALTIDRTPIDDERDYSLEDVQERVDELLAVDERRPR